MRAWLAIAAGIAIGGGLAWWLARETPAQADAKQERAARAADAQARDSRPSLYRWRDETGVLHVTETPPKGREYERLAREGRAGIAVKGDAGGRDEE